MCTDKEEKRGRSFLDSTSYQALDENHKLIMNLRDLGHHIWFLSEGRAGQKRILILLLETGVITQRALTEKLRVQPGSVSEVIGKLEAAGLILRTPSAQDRRTTDIQLTEEGRIQAEIAAAGRKTRYQEMLSCLSLEEKTELLALTEKLVRDWSSRYRDQPRKG